MRTGGASPDEGRIHARGTRPRGFSAALALAVVVFLCCSASAAAQTGHAFISKMTAASPGNSLAEPEAVAVDGADNLYVADAKGTGVVVYGPSGEFKSHFGEEVISEVAGLAVDASGKVYVAEPAGVIRVFKPDGFGGYSQVAEWNGANTPEGGFIEIGGVAIDTSTNKADPSAGDIYVVDKGNNAVYKFEPPGEEAKEGKFLSVLKGKPAFEEPKAIAVRPSTGQVYVVTTILEKNAVQVFSNAGIFQMKISGLTTPPKAFGNVVAVGVEDSTGDVYVTDAENAAIDQFGPAGEWLGWLTGIPASGRVAHFAALRGTALNSAGDLYVAAEGAVDKFGPNIVVPSAASVKPTKITRTAAILNGSINTFGKATEYFFEYGEVGGSRLVTATHTAAAGESKVQAALEGLHAGGGYEFRLVAKSEGQLVEGAPIAFETLPAVAGVSTGPPNSISAASAVLTGSLTPQGIATKYRFEYGQTPFYGKQSPVPYLESSSALAVPVASEVTGLQPNTTYHYRLVTFNEFGTTYGADVQFKTTGPTIVNKATAPIGLTTATAHMEINPDGLIARYHIEYGTTTAYGASTAAQEIPAGNALVPREEELSALKLATTYHYRVVVVSEEAGKEVGTFFGADQTFTTGPIDSESATAVTGESALLKAQVNTLGAGATYHFEYGTTDKYGTSVPEPDVTLEARSGDQLAQAAVTGLHPGVTYHYRVVVTIAGIEEKGLGGDQTFTTATGGVAFHLPDARAYELVSPPNKHGGFIEALTKQGGVIQSSTDGNAFTFLVDGPIVENPEGNRSPEAQQALSIRGSSAWATRQIATPHDRPFGLRPGRPPEYQFFSADLSLSAVQPFPYALTTLAEPPLSPPLTEAEKGHQEKTIYVRDNAPLAPESSERALYEEAAESGRKLAEEHSEEAKPGYVPLVSPANVAPGTQFGGRVITSTRLETDLTFLTATPDLSHSLLYSEVALAPHAPSAPGLYEWAGGTLQLVSVLPNGLPLEGRKADLGFGTANNPTNWRRALSNDGSRVFWSVAEVNEVSELSGAGHLYVRDTAKARTLQIDVPEAGLAVPERGEALFQTASADGTRVFFTDPQRLTADSTAVPHKADLYECQLIEVAGSLECKLHDLTVDRLSNESATVRGLVAGASEDGSSIYFVASGVLAPGGMSGAYNLYAAHNGGAGWATRFIARLSSEDAPVWGVTNLGAVRPEEMSLSARVSPNGRYLAFMSKERLTGYNNTDVNETETEEEDAHTGLKIRTKAHLDEEVFLYDSNEETTKCVSCNPSGARPTGVYDTTLAGEGAGLLVDRPETWGTLPLPNGAVQTTGVDHWLAGSLPAWTHLDIQQTTYQSRYLSDQGRLFFTSADPLVPAASGSIRSEIIPGVKGEGVNAAVGVENVYQYEPGEVGSCAGSSGCVGLISSGTSSRESAFLDASVSGNDAFILTAASLVPQDEDSSYDVYDARVCTEASPCQTPPEPPKPPCASTEECRPGSPPPVFEVPASSTFSGPGNRLHVVASGGTLPSKVTVPPKPTNAQKLSAALKKCRKLPHRTRGQRARRARCEAQAKRQYGAKKARKARTSARSGVGR